MTKHITLACALATLGLTGCVATSPEWDARFGEATRGLTAQQVISPEASLNTNPVNGIDGKAANGAMDQYTKSFTRPTAQPELSLTGGSIGGGGAR